jgi:hypothetical protein
MTQHPIELANILLMLLGAILVVSGPVIVYRTVKGMREIRKVDAQGDVHWWSNGINLVIALVFFAAGILFIVNNLRGNPLA